MYQPTHPRNNIQCHYNVSVSESVAPTNIPISSSDPPSSADVGKKVYSTGVGRLSSLVPPELVSVEEDQAELFLYFAFYCLNYGFENNNQNPTKGGGWPPFYHRAHHILFCFTFIRHIRTWTVLGTTMDGACAGEWETCLASVRRSVPCLFTLHVCWVRARRLKEDI